jgi:hypothetical protein
MIRSTPSTIKFLGPAPNMCWIKGGRKAGPMIRQKMFAVDGQLVRAHPGSCNCEQVLADPKHTIIGVRWASGYGWLCREVWKRATTKSHHKAGGGATEGLAFQY